MAMNMNCSPLPPAIIGLHYLEVCIGVRDVIFLCLSIFMSDHNPLTDFPRILIGILGRTTGIFLAWF